jgi:glycosyltransferase involved in cell wall biosynthesis
MHVAIDCRYIRERPSGIGTYVQALVDRLPAIAGDAGFDLWTSPRAPRALSTAANVRSHRVGWDPNNLPTLLWPARLAPVDGVDVLHMPYNILGRGIRCATVVTVHDLMWLSAPQRCQEGVWQLLYRVPFYQAGIRMALGRATRIIAVTHATADVIAAAHPAAAARVRVIRHGVAARFRPAADGTPAAPVTGPFFLVLGQNAPYKNHRAVIEAFAAAELPAAVRLVMVQRLSPGGALVRDAHRLGVQDRVVWCGGANDDEVLALLQSALALVQFSLDEGFGMPALEAMACGTPVLASDIPALREVLGPAGVKVPLEPGALAQAMRRAATDAAWRRDLAGLGLERARAFDWDRSAAEHLAVYREASAAR